MAASYFTLHITHITHYTLHILHTTHYTLHTSTLILLHYTKYTFYTLHTTYYTLHISPQIINHASRGCQGKGRRSWAYTRLLHSLHPSPSPFSLPLSLLHPVASLSLPLPLSLSKGSGAQGFGTERARLVVQVERLWCTRLRHRTCKTSGSSQKKGLLPMGISIFFSQKGPATYGDFDFFSQNTSDFEN